MLRMLRIALGANALLFAGIATAEVSFSISIGPPALPVYEQPPIPAPGYIWTPGYWAYGPEGYYWVPGTWVEPPQPGLLWTPGYWAWSDGNYGWNPGYWAPVVGFYGGINYGFGYTGHGYDGGYWQGRQFYYNSTVNNVTNVTNVTNVYTRNVTNETVNRVSYAGGPGGVDARPTPQEQKAAAVPHVPPTSVQQQHRQAASTHRELLASQNQGRPPIAATAKPADFSSHAVPAARAGGPVAPTHEAAPPPVTHARDLALTAPRPAPPAAASEAERQQAELEARHEQERQSLQQQQEREHAAYVQRPPNPQAYAAMEQQHQRQAQEMQQRHAQEAQAVHAPPPQQAAHAPPPRPAPRPGNPEQGPHPP